MTSNEIKKIMKNERIYQWELAKAIGISEFTLSRWLRGSLSKEHEEVIIKAINGMFEEPIIEI